MAKVAKRRGRYVLDFYDNQGKRQRKTLPAGSTKAKAKEVLRDIEDQLAKGVYLPDKKIPTFAEVSADWLEYKRLNLRASTLSMYQGHLKNHFQDIYPLKINRISAAAVEKFITKHQTGGMNLTTLRKLIVTFNQVMQYAIRHKYVDHNPVRDAERPRGQGGEEKEEIRILTGEEINALLDVEENSTCFSGLRYSPGRVKVKSSV